MDAKFQVACNHIVGNPKQSFTLLACPRCLGSGFYNALSYGPDGKVVLVSGFNKLQQQIQKILTENKRPTGYGFDYSVLTSTINAATITAIKSEISRCLLYLQGSQQQEKSEGFFYLPTEEIDKLLFVDVQINPSDPRGVFVTAQIQTISGKPTDVTSYLRK